MEASNRSLVHVYCTVALTSYFLELFFLLPQFMYVLISPGALTQCIMSISAKSDAYYVKWCCYAILLMMSLQTDWPFISFPSWHFTVQ